MRTFYGIFRDGVRCLRQTNPLKRGGLISDKAYDEHEALYLEGALVFDSPVTDQNIFNEEELKTLWQFNEGGYWIDVSAPEFIETTPQQYRQVFRLRDTARLSFQDNVGLWVSQTFGEKVMSDIPERCFRFIEEAIELAQAFGVSKEDVLRHVTRTYARPQGEISQEVGGTLVTLAALCQAANLDLQKCGDAELANNWQRKDAIRDKWLQKIAINP